PHFANTLFGNHRQRSSTTPDIQHCLAWPQLGYIRGCLPQRLLAAAKHCFSEDPHEKVIEPAPVENCTSRLSTSLLIVLRVIVYERMHRSCSFPKNPLFCNE